MVGGLGLGGGETRGGGFGRHPARVGALRTELCRGGEWPAAIRTFPRQGCGALLAEFSASLVVVLAPRALHRGPRPPSGLAPPRLAQQSCGQPRRRTLVSAQIARREQPRRANASQRAARLRCRAPLVSSRRHASCHRPQFRLRLLQPEAHAHLAKHRPRGAELGLGLLGPTASLVELAEA